MKIVIFEYQRNYESHYYIMYTGTIKMVIFGYQRHYDSRYYIRNSGTMKIVILEYQRNYESRYYIMALAKSTTNPPSDALLLLTIIGRPTNPNPNPNIHPNTSNTPIRIL